MKRPLTNFKRKKLLRRTINDFWDGREWDYKFKTRQVNGIADYRRRSGTWGKGYVSN